MSSVPQREINARLGRAGSRRASPSGGVPSPGGGPPGSPGAGGSGQPGSSPGSGSGAGGGRGPGGAAAGEGLTLRGFFGVFRYSRRAIELVWSTNAVLTVAL